MNRKPLDLVFNLDIEGVTEKIGKLQSQVTEDMLKAGENLANMTVAKTRELADQELGSLKQLYQDNIAFDTPEKGFWVITLKEPALWIEEGRKSGFMEELLNGKSSRIGQNGRYAVIPFTHNKNPSTQSPKAYDLAQTIKYELQKKGISWKKIERDENDSPRVGLLHRFDLETARPVDAQKPIHKKPLTSGVAVYQNVYDSNGERVTDISKARDMLSKKQGQVKKEVLTFRVITEEHKNEGLWVHPGREGNKLMDKAFEWAKTAWERDILPTIFAKYKGK